MSRYSGKQGRGARARTREQLRREAYQRQCAYMGAYLAGGVYAQAALDPKMMLPAGAR